MKKQQKENRATGPSDEDPDATALAVAGAESRGDGLTPTP